jgi:predicted lipid-binding transport protein (Tim44 family)
MYIKLRLGGEALGRISRPGPFEGVMEGLPFLDIIFFAMLAAFLALRLKSVLGRRTGTEKRRADPFQPQAELPKPDGAAALPDRDRRALESLSEQASGPLASGLARIKAADPRFDEREFVSGARMAFEMIVAAFAKGDLAALKPLLSADVFAKFKRAVDDRAAAQETLETTLIGITATDLVEADMRGREALVTLKFTSEQVNVTRDPQGTTVDGDPQRVVTIVDIWTFARDTASRDPNWALVETRSPN